MNWQKSMFRLLGGSAICGMLFLACGKDSFNSKPSLEFLSTAGNDLEQGDLLQINLMVRDKEGDISDTLFVESFTRRCPNSIRMLKPPMPEIPPKANLEAKISLNYLVNVANGEYPTWTLDLCRFSDTLEMSFWIKDKAGNISDTIKLPQPIIIKND